MGKGRKYVIDLLQQQCEDDAKSLTNQKQLYFEVMTNSEAKLLEIVQRSDSKAVQEQIKEIENLSGKKTAVNDVLNDVIKTLEYEVGDL